MYYISKTLIDARTRYLPLEKLVLALVHATRKLPHYFQAHTVYVLTKYPLQSVMKISDFTSWIAKWGTWLRFFDIRYRPRSSVKGQVLADFVAEFSLRRKMEVIFHVIRGRCLKYTGGWSRDCYYHSRRNKAGTFFQVRVQGL